MSGKQYTLKNLAGLILISVLFIQGTAFCQEPGDEIPPQYLFPAFSVGKLTMKDGSSKTLNLNYNTLSGKMVFIQDEDYYDLINQELVDTAYISGRKLVPYNDAFLEVIIDDKVSFLIQHVSNLEEKGASSGYGTYSTTTAIGNYSSISMDSQFYNLKIPDVFELKLEQNFWLKDGSTWAEFNNEKKFLDLFPDEADLLKKFRKDNKLKYRKEEDMVKLVKYLNELIS